MRGGPAKGKEAARRELQHVLAGQVIDPRIVHQEKWPDPMNLRLEQRVFQRRVQSSEESLGMIIVVDGIDPVGVAADQRIVL
jgi:hypothetical protein